MFKTIRTDSRLFDEIFSLIEIIRNYPTDPGTSDLDNGQPIHVPMTLGDYRRAVGLYYELRKE